MRVNLSGEVKGLVLAETLISMLIIAICMLAMISTSQMVGEATRKTSHLTTLNNYNITCINDIKRECKSVLGNPMKMVGNYFSTSDIKSQVSITDTMLNDCHVYYVSILSEMKTGEKAKASCVITNVGLE